MKIDKIREMILIALYRIDKEDAYSNLVIDETINKNRDKLDIKDINFLSEIVYGTVTMKLSIDCIIQKYSKIKLKKISPWIINIMRMAVYQIIFLDKVPKSAAVNEAVNLSKKYGSKSSGFVNSILRKIEKSDYEEFTKIENTKERISKMYSMPEWIIQELKKDCKIEKIEEICKNSNMRPMTTIRANTLKITENDLCEELIKKKIKFEKCGIENFLNIKEIKNLGNLDLLKQGMITVQDESAGKTAIILNPKPGEKVLDICSAPGGKTTHMAELMKNEGKIIAVDLYKSRLNLVKENANRLGIDIIETMEKDAQIYYEEFEEQFDKILADVPCLGIGVIRRKPDIKWKRKKEDLESIKIIQNKILTNCIKYLKKGGELVYSTCSILEEENDKMIRQTIKISKINGINLELLESIKIYTTEKSDGFFIAKLKKY